MNEGTSLTAASFASEEDRARVWKRRSTGTSGACVRTATSRLSRSTSTTSELRLSRRRTVSRRKLRLPRWTANSSRSATASRRSSTGTPVSLRYTASRHSYRREQHQAQCQPVYFYSRSISRNRLQHSMCQYCANRKSK